MGQISVEISQATGLLLSGNQHFMVQGIRTGRSQEIELVV